MSRKLTVIKQNKQRRRKMFFRRILTVTCIIGFFGLIGFSVYIDRSNRLSEAEAQYLALQQELNEILAQQEYYRSEISKLANEDYIAMLARERYFKSHPNEVLFRFLEDSEQQSEN